MRNLNFKSALALLVLFVATPLLAANDGTLDPAFGIGGKVQLPQEGSWHGDWYATDVALQSTGKIVIAGWTNRSLTQCFVLRLNIDGSLDTSFGGGNGFSPGYYGFEHCRYASVVVRADDRILAGGEDLGNTQTRGYIEAFTANGQPDASFGTQATAAYFLEPNSGDPSIEINRIALDADGNIIAAGQYLHMNGNRDFHVARIAADGSSSVQANYSFQTASSNDDIAYDLAIAPDGSYYLGGTATSNLGDSDCALAHFHYTAQNGIEPDATFTGNVAGITIGLNYGGNNADYCFALAYSPPPFDGLLLGGGSYEGTNYNVATFIAQPLNGSATGRAVLPFDYGTEYAGEVNYATRVLTQAYDGRPVVIGYGPNHASNPPTSYDIGVMRVADTSFGNNGKAFYDVGSTASYANQNTAASAVFDGHGRLLIVGRAQDTLGGSDLIAIRLAPFDGIFKNGFDALQQIHGP